MIRHLLVSAALMTTACSSALASDLPVHLCVKRANDLLQSLQNKNFNAATTYFDDRMKSGLDAEKLGQVWNVLLPQKWGAYEHADDAHATPNAAGETVTNALHFAHGLLLMKVSCDTNGSITGLFFAPAAAATDAYPLATNEHRQSVSSPLGPLPGTLTLPQGNGPFPAVLLIAGSGPEDRDETIGGNKPLRDLAQGLANAGIASLRYDKRTKVYGAKMLGQSVTIDEEVTDDAVNAFHQLAALAPVDPRRVFILGHSLGALMAPRIGQRVPGAAGLILLAAPATFDLDVILRQTRYVASQQAVSKQNMEVLTAPIIVARNALAHAKSTRPPAGLFFNAPASYWLSLRDYDAVAAAQHLAMPMLILQGQRDYQVTPNIDFARWRAAFFNDKRVQLKLYPGLSHLFMPGSNPPSPDDYQRAGHVDDGVIRDIATWILEQPAARMSVSR